MSATSYASYNDELNDSLGDDETIEESEASDSGESLQFMDRFSLNYFGVIHGPGLRYPTIYQPQTRNGYPDIENPIVLRNFLGLTYQASEKVNVGLTGAWVWQASSQQPMMLQDPLVRVSHTSLASGERWNLYGDARLHLPVSSISAENNLKFGLQFVQVLSSWVGDGALNYGLVASSRFNTFGSQGFGNNIELYLSPFVNYQIAKDWALTALYEMHANQVHGASLFQWASQGMDFEPGVSWNITPSLNFNPYFHIPITQGFRLASTSIGAMLSWNLF